MSQPLPVRNRLDAKRRSESLLYSPERVRALTLKTIEMLGLQEGDRLVELGCGSGRYSLDILQQIKMRHRIIGVESQPELLEQIPMRAFIARVQLDPFSFAACAGTYDKIFMMDELFYVDNRPLFLSNLRARLVDDGILLIVHTPPPAPYPLFERARRSFEDWVIDSERLTRLMDEAGFRVDRGRLEFDRRVPKQEYFGMVRRRFLPELTWFGDREISEGLEELQKEYRRKRLVRFTERFDFLRGVAS